MHLRPSPSFFTSGQISCAAHVCQMGPAQAMGVQVPRRVHAEVPQLGHCIPRACPAQGMQDRRRTSDARPRAYSHILILIPPKYSVAESAVVVVGPCLVWRLMAGRISGMGATILLIS